jgi:hypothetical protein
VVALLKILSRKRTMRILWIENFGEARHSESDVLAIFKALL